MNKYFINNLEFKTRRQNLVKEIIREHFLSQIIKEITSDISYPTVFIIIVGNFETSDCYLFKQDPNFLYLTGLSLAGLILVIETKLKCEKKENSILWKIISEKEFIFQPSAEMQARYQLNIEPWAKSLNKQQLIEFKIEDAGSSMIRLHGTHEPHGKSIIPKWITPTLDFSYYNNLWKYIRNLPSHTLLYMNDAQSRLGKTGLLSSIFVERIIQEIQNQKLQISCISCIKQIEKLRQHKSEKEVQLLILATQISVDAHLQVMKQLSTFSTDRQVESFFLSWFYSKGASPSYQPIVLIGEKGNQLHGVADGSFLEPQQLLLLDVAASFYGYKSDITRTLPIPYQKKSQFTTSQKKIYDFLLNLLENVAHFIQPGIYIYKDLPGKPSLQSITYQYVKSSFFSSQDKEAFLQHGIGHHVGLETHDPEIEPLAPNNMIALETGFYSSPFVSSEFKNINIRIENIYQVTSKGFILISYLPITIQDIENKINTNTKKNLLVKQHDLFE